MHITSISSQSTPTPMHLVLLRPRRRPSTRATNPVIFPPNPFISPHLSSLLSLFLSPSLQAPRNQRRKEKKKANHSPRFPLLLPLQQRLRLFRHILPIRRSHRSPLLPPLTVRFRQLSSFVELFFLPALLSTVCVSCMGKERGRGGL